MSFGRRSACAALLLASVLAAQPRHIVSAAPSITEILFALGLGDRVVGVSNFCHYPPEALQKPKIGTYLEPSIETILSLRPDLVVIQTNPIHLKDRLESAKLHTLEVQQDTVANIYGSILAIGREAGVDQRAAALRDQIRAALAQIHERAARLHRVRMMFIVGRIPGTLEDLVVVGRASYLGELIDVAGGENVFEDAVAMYPKVSAEEVLARNPDVIIDMGDMTRTDGVTEEHKRSVVELWSRRPTLSAVRNHRVYAVASDIFVVPGPRMAQAARAFAQMLHPEAGF